jgi:hypothetical protein
MLKEDYIDWDFEFYTSMPIVPNSIPNRGSLLDLGNNPFMLSDAHQTTEVPAKRRSP